MAPVAGSNTRLFDKLAALYEVERDNRRSVYLNVRKIFNRRERELDPLQQIERRNVPSQVTLHLLCVYHFTLPTA